MGKFALIGAGVEIIFQIFYYHFWKENIMTDWTSYVAQGETVLDGIYDYSKITGPMGPIAYLAGHAWYYALLSYFKISTSFRKSQQLQCCLQVIYTYVKISIAEKTFK